MNQGCRIIQNYFETISEGESDLRDYFKNYETILEDESDLQDYVKNYETILEDE